MEKHDYSKFKSVSIRSDLPITFVGDNYRDIDDIYEFFKHLGINTLEELFVAYDNGLFNDRRKKYNAEVKGQTELLMSYYMGTPLIAEDILEEWVNIGTIKDIESWVFDDKRIVESLTRLGITKEERRILHSFIYIKRDFIIASRNRNTQIIDIIESFAADKEYQSGIVSDAFGKMYSKIIQNIKFKTDFFKKYLKSKKDIEMGLIKQPTYVDRELVQKLEEQMKYLLRARNNLDAQIELLQSQLSNIRKSREIRK